MIRKSKRVMARYPAPRPARRRRVPFVLFAAALIGFTAVQVGALWKHSPGELSSAQDERLQAKVVDELAGRDAEIMRKVTARLQADPSDLEAELLKGLLYFKAGYRDRALAVMEDLTGRAPKFHLAHLIRGDLLLVQMTKTDDLGSNGLLNTLTGGKAEQLDRLRSEAGARLQGYLTMIDGGHVPSGLLLLDTGIRHALVVDKSQHRLYVYENGGSDTPPRLVANYYCVIGKIPGNKTARGDQRTPEGVYFLSQRIPDEELPDRYGMEAYPLNYPNEYDGRLGKTGDGIWLHGTDKDFYSRPPLDSDGCVVLANDDLQRVARFIQPGATPVIIADRLEWLTPEEWGRRRGELYAQVEAWRRDWESCRVEDYLRHYARDFYSEGCDLSRWEERKRRIAQGKVYQKVALSGLTLLAYPPAAAGGREMVVARFRQDYRSNNFVSDMDKRLYFVREGQGWKIWHEGGL